MSKLFFRVLLTALLVTACDQAAEVEERQLQVAAKAESVEHVTKMINGCMTVEFPAAVKLEIADADAAGVQGYTLTIDSRAVVDDTECMADVVLSWQ